MCSCPLDTSAWMTTGTPGHVHKEPVHCPVLGLVSGSRPRPAPPEHSAFFPLPTVSTFCPGPHPPHSNVNAKWVDAPECSRRSCVYTSLSPCHKPLTDPHSQRGLRQCEHVIIPLLGAKQTLSEYQLVLPLLSLSVLGLWPPEQVTTHLVAETTWIYHLTVSLGLMGI